MSKIRVWSFFVATNKSLKSFLLRLLNCILRPFPIVLLMFNLVRGRNLKMREKVVQRVPRQLPPSKEPRHAWELQQKHVWPFTPIDHLLDLLTTITSFTLFEVYKNWHFYLENLFLRYFFVVILLNIYIYYVSAILKYNRLVKNW